MYTNALLTKEVFLSTVTEVSSEAILLFGGTLEQSADRPQVLTMEQRMYEFEMDRNTVELLLQLRAEMDSLLAAKLADPQLDISNVGAHIINAVVQLLSDKQHEPASSDRRLR